MRITEELDALRSIGIAPMEMLVIPKLVGLVLALALQSGFYISNVADTANALATGVATGRARVVAAIIAVTANAMQGDRERFRVCAALQMTSLGMPVVYYGEEVLAGGRRFRLREDDLRPAFKATARISRIQTSCDRAFTAGRRVANMSGPNGVNWPSVGAPASTVIGWTPRD